VNARFGLVVSAFVLAACGGGGGSSTPVTPPGSTGGAPVQQTSVQRSLASQALAGTQTASQIAQFGGSGSLGTLSLLRRTIDAAVTRTSASANRTPLAVVCSAGVELSTIPIGTTETQIHEQTFYDSGCFLLFQDIQLDVVANATSGTLSGSETQYTRAGAVNQYNTISGTLAGVGTSNVQLSLQVTDAASSSSPQIAVAGLSCNVSLTAQSCGSGAVAHRASLSEDFGATINASASGLTVGSATTFVFSGNGASYKGGYGALTLKQGAFPAWAVTGGTVTDAVTLSAQLTFNSAGILTGGSLSLVDSGDDATVNIVASGSPLVITGVIKQADNGQTVATFNVDASGNGTITYSNGSTFAIVAWQVMG